MLTPEIKSKINWLWNRFWAGGLANPITAIEQLSYLLFIRRLEHVDGGKLVKNDEYKWSQFKNNYPDPQDLLDHVKRKVFPYIKSLNDAHEPFSRQMSDATFEIDKPSLLIEAMNIIDDIYVEIDTQVTAGQHFQDIQGDVYEYLLNATSQAGKNGQFRTPRHLIEFICEIISPDSSDSICDVTCGSGGFLVGAYQHILSKNSSVEFKIKDENGFEKSSRADLLSDVKLRTLKNHAFFGFDNDKTMVRIGLMNLIMHGITEPKIEKLDSLSDAYDNFETFNLITPQTIFESKGIGSIDELYSIILANPPFTGRIDKSTLSPKLGRVDTSQSELLFLDRIIHMLKPNGKAAVIVPEGVLFGTSRAQKSIREILLKDCNLQAVLSLPAGAFYPYTGVKTSILIFEKKQLYSTQFNTTKVWFYGISSDGYSLDSNRKKLKDNPLPLIVDEWKNREIRPQDIRTNNHFYVELEEIIENNLELNYDQYKEIVYEEIEHTAPDKLLKSLFSIEEELIKQLNELKNLI